MSEREGLICHVGAGGTGLSWAGHVVVGGSVRRGSPGMGSSRWQGKVRQGQSE